MINRFEWLKAVLQADVSDSAKALASALSVQFANDGTGQINPSRKTLADYLGKSEKTIKRAVAELEGSGWLARTAGRGRGNATEYTLLSPGNVVPLRPVNGAGKGVTSDPKRGHERPLLQAGKGVKPVREKGSNLSTPIIRKEQSSEQKGRAPERDAPACPIVSERIVRDDDPALHEWRAWLAEKGWGTLEDLGLHRPGQGYALPLRWPPQPHDDEGNRQARAFFEWVGAQRGGQAARASAGAA